MRRFSVMYMCILVGAVLLPPVALCAEKTISREYKIKAAYLYNLIKFVNWPSAASSEMQTLGHTSICVLGHNPFLTHLEKLGSRQARGRGIDVKYIVRLEPPHYCNIIFISGQNENSSQLLNNSQLMSPSALIVGEGADFVDGGGIVSLVVNNNNVKLRINLTQAKKIGFEISGNLLEVAEVVE